MTHLAFNDFDMSAVTDKVTKCKRDTLSADYDIEKKEEGIVSIQIDHPIKRDGTFVIYEIHKVGRKRFVGHKVYWLVQLYSKDSQHSKPVTHGCSFGETQVGAVYEADKDILNNFLNVLDFKSAYEMAMKE